MNTNVAWLGCIVRGSFRPVWMQVVRIEDAPFGKRYIVDGELTAPDKRKPQIRAIWFIEIGEDVPYLVTAYPLEKA
jgi:uncharacterized protein DUF6883